MNTDDRTTPSMTRVVRLAALGLALLLTLAACGIGGSSKNNTHPTATTSTTIKLEASPTATKPPTRAGTPAVSSTPVVATPATTSPKASPGTHLPAKASPPAASPVASPGATPASGEPPVVTSCSPSKTPPFTGNNPNYVTTEQGVNFRSGPGTDCATLGDPLESGTAVTVVSDPVTRKGDTNQWVEVQINGQDGWVAANLIQPAQ